MLYSGPQHWLSEPVSSSAGHIRDVNSHVPISWCEFRIKCCLQAASLFVVTLSAHKILRPKGFSVLTDGETQPVKGQAQRPVAGVGRPERTLCLPPSCSVNRNILLHVALLLQREFSLALRKYMNCPGVYWKNPTYQSVWWMFPPYSRLAHKFCLLVVFVSWMRIFMTHYTELLFCCWFCSEREGSLLDFVTSKRFFILLWRVF